MNDIIVYAVINSISVITFKNPPVNALGTDLRTAISDGLARGIRVRGESLSDGAYIDLLASTLLIKEKLKCRFRISIKRHCSKRIVIQAGGRRFPRDGERAGGRSSRGRWRR